MIRIRCELETHEVETISDQGRMKSKICDHLTNTSSFSWLQRRLLVKRLENLSKNQIHLIAAKPTDQIDVYFLCETFRSIIVLKDMVDNKNLIIVLEDLLENVLKLKSPFLRVTLDQTEYDSNIRKARITSTYGLVEFNTIISFRILNCHSASFSQFRRPVFSSVLVVFLLLKSFSNDPKRIRCLWVTNLSVWRPKAHNFFL